jgi:hypothetical protein
MIQKGPQLSGDYSAPSKDEATKQDGKVGNKPMADPQDDNYSIAGVSWD